MCRTVRELIMGIINRFLVKAQLVTSSGREGERERARNIADQGFWT